MADAGRSTIDGALCIVGAGIAGLNALFVATEYLHPSDTVVLIDRNKRCGGMWNETYDFVRLHQPHQLFAVGNLQWSLQKPPSYLATKGEVLDYFAQCIAELKRRINLVELYEHEVASIEDGKDAVTVRATHMGTGADVVVRVQRCIDAFSANVAAHSPLPISSKAVLSTTPEQLFQTEGGGSGSAPVYVIGGGKTAMDVAGEMLRRQPTRPVTMIVGKGTVFLNREKLFPDGRQRWFGGSVTQQILREVVSRFDGSNEGAAFDYYRRTYCIGLDDGFQQHFFGILSPQENDLLRKQLANIRTARFVDVVDGASGPSLLQQDVAPESVPPGSVFVNCTGYLLRGQVPSGRFLSASGRILTVCQSEAVHFLGSVTAYFLTHVFLRGKAGTLPFLTVNLEAARRRDRVVYLLAGMTVSYHNTLLILRSLPPTVLLKCGLDFDRWYPLHRRAQSVAMMSWRIGRQMEHCRAALDRLVQRYPELMPPKARSTC